jgi:hypothetical protein
MFPFYLVPLVFGQVLQGFFGNFRFFGQVPIVVQVIFDHEFSEVAVHHGGSPFERSVAEKMSSACKGS